jgi:glycosyltransferase involved in cell wall biosynthesis
MKKVLFISAWYPHKYDPMAGLFVRKHAAAVSLYCDVRVLYVHADESIDFFKIEENTNSNPKEIIVYYPFKKSGIISKIPKTINYFRAYRKGFRYITKTGFVPEIIHVNILTRTGFIAWLIKKRKKIPYVISEHWSRYLPIRNSYKGLIRKLITRLVVKNSEAVLTVSESLKNAMLSHKLYNQNYTVVNNVVDDFFFEDIEPEPRSKKRMIHVSCFDENAKNVCGILRATMELSKIRQDFELIIIGTGIDFKKVFAYFESLHFPKETVRFLGEKTPHEVAYWMKQSDFFVLFSNYETAGVVVAESLVCGKPVLSTKVGIAPDYIDNANGKLISAGSEKELLESMQFLLENLHRFNNTEIKVNAQKIFNYPAVGLKIFTIYSKIVP